MSHEEHTAVGPMFLSVLPEGHEAVPAPQVRTPHSGVRLTEVEQAIRARDAEATKVYAFPVPRAFAGDDAPESATRPFDTGRARAHDGFGADTARGALRTEVNEDTAPALAPPDPFAAHHAAMSAAGSVTRLRVHDDDATRFDVVSPWAHVTALETTLCSPGVVREESVPAERRPASLVVDEPLSDVGGLPRPMFSWVEAVCERVLGAALTLAGALAGAR